jgi:hypothetical protein
VEGAVFKGWDSTGFPINVQSQVMSKKYSKILKIVRTTLRNTELGISDFEGVQKLFHTFPQNYRTFVIQECLPRFHRFSENWNVFYVQT